MKKAIYPLIYLLLSFSAIQAQSQRVDSVPGKSQSISLSISVPVSSFAQSHVAGAGVDYSWSNKRFANKKLPVKSHFGVTANAGVEYFMSKKITTTGYPFRYNNYLYLHALAGIIYNTTPSIYTALTAGPSAGIYDGNIRGGLMTVLSGQYYINEKISIGPSASYRKHSGTNGLLTMGLRVSCIF
jgi:hypothetical protein